MKKNFKIDQKLFRHISNCVCTFAVTVLITSLISDKIDMETFQAMIFGGILCGIFSYLFFEKKIISHHITVRRFLCLLCDMCTLPTCFYGFGAAELNTKSLCIYLICAGIGIVNGMLLGFIADRLEKKYLREINAKLEKNK